MQTADKQAKLSSKTQLQAVAGRDAEADCHCHIARKDLFGFIRATMRIAAMCPLQLDEQLPQWLRFLALILDLLLELLLYFVTIHIAILYVCTLYLYYSDGDLEFFVNCLIQAIIYIWTIFMKFYFRRIRPRSLTDLIDSINERYSTRSALGFQYVTMDESLATSNWWLKVYVYFCFLGTVFWVALPITYGDRSLPLTCWYPFDFKAPIVYEAMYFLQFIGQLQVAAAFSASSGFYMGLSILMSGQYDVLYCSLKNLFATGNIQAGAGLAELSKLRSQQDIANGERNQYYCAVEHTTPPACYAHCKPRPLPRPLHLRAAIKSAFRSCVDQHRYIVGVLRKIEAFYSPIWFFKVGEVIFLMCLVAFVSVKVRVRVQQSTTANSSFMKILSLGQYLLLVAWELLIICYFGEMVTINSQRCGEALLRSPWYLYMREMKSDFLLFLLNSQRSFKLTAGKIFPLNTDRFQNTITTAFSFLTLLQKMDNRN